MRKSLCVGMLRGTKTDEQRTPLAPADVEWLIRRGICVEVESSPERVFKDDAYRRKGARIVESVRSASLLLGIKAPRIEDLYPDKIYMFFSHTHKGQPQNMPLLKACLRKRITLIDYEAIVDFYGRRLTHFGRFAGICGAVDCLYYMGKKLQGQGLRNPFSLLHPAYKYASLEEMKKAMKRVSADIYRKRLPKEITPFIIGITGHGNVSKGAQEILEPLHPIEVHPKDMLKFVRNKKHMYQRVYKIVFLREEKLRAKDGRGFYFEEYLNFPQRFVSNLDLYLPYVNMLIHASYWDKRFPRLMTKEMIHQLSRKKTFRLQFIGDISCDINGSIELTYKAASADNPTFTYDPKKKTYADGYNSSGITILAVDNLPSELPRDSSVEFSSLIREYVYQIAVHGAKDITNHIALPMELRRAVIIQQGRLNANFNYLKKYI